MHIVIRVHRIIANFEVDGKFFLYIFRLSFQQRLLILPI